MSGLAVVGLVVNDGSVLLLHRTKMPVCWGPPGGHVECNETFHNALEREIWEETGLQCSVGIPVDVWSGVSNGERLQSITFVCDSQSRSITLSEEHDDYAWVSIAELDKWKEKTDFDVSNWKYLLLLAEYYKKLKGDVEE